MHHASTTERDKTTAAAAHPTEADPTEAGGLRVRGLHVRFGDIHAVQGLDLVVRAGHATALIGRNGAGKSTSLKVLAGVLPAAEGTVLVDGIDAIADPLAAKRVVGYCPDVGGLIPQATPWEHLALAARMRRLGPSWQQRARDLLEQFELGSAAHRVCAGFSHGMSRRLSVLLAGFHEPRVLLLDEPFDGVDPLGVDATMDLVGSARAQGAAVVVSTHLLDLAVQCCAEAVVLRGGRQVGAAPAVDLVGTQGAARYRDLLS